MREFERIERFERTERVWENWEIWENWENWENWEIWENWDRDRDRDREITYRICSPDNFFPELARRNSAAACSGFQKALTRIQKQANFAIRQLRRRQINLHSPCVNHQKKISWSLDWNWWGRAFRKEILQLMAKKSSLDSPQERRLATTEVIMRQQQIGSIRWWWWCTRKTRKERERKTGPFERSVFSDLISLTHTHTHTHTQGHRQRAGENKVWRRNGCSTGACPDANDCQHDGMGGIIQTFALCLHGSSPALDSGTHRLDLQHLEQTKMAGTPLQHSTLLLHCFPAFSFFHCFAKQLSSSFTALVPLGLSVCFFAPLLHDMRIFQSSKQPLSLSLSVSLCHLVQRKIGNSMTDWGFFRSSKSWLQSFGFEQEQKGLELIGWVHLYIISWEQFLLQDFWETPLKQGSEQACSFALEIDFHEH